MTYVAFLRGINVGGRIIKMDALRACFTKLGLTDVSTILQTGNVLFSTNETDTQAITKTIEAGLTQTFDYPARVVVHDTETLKAIVQNNPFTEVNPDEHRYIVFLSKDIGQEIVENLPSSGADRVALGSDVIYWCVTKGQTLKSPLGMLLSKPKYKEFNTVRNVNTVEKLIT